jgi:gentisate 1,2-dioxygenase
MCRRGLSDIQPACGICLLSTRRATMGDEMKFDDELSFDAVKDLDSLYALLDGKRMKNGWAKPTPSLYPEPKQKFVPAHWSFADARAALHAAGRLVGTEWAERRNLILANPIPGNEYPTVDSLVAAYQMVKGGETARSHRHTPNAMRVVVETQGDRVYTIVNGEKVPMEPGDVLLTPNWCYHGHSNESTYEAYWIDILDAPLVQLLGPMFFEHHPDSLEQTDVIAPESPMRFAYRDYMPRLLATTPIASGVRSMRLGPPTMATTDRTAIHLDGSTSRYARSTASYIFVVVRGEGTSIVGEQKFAWGRGDVIAAPHWLPHSHTAKNEAVLIQVSDAPLMEALSWLRVEEI